MGRVGIAIRGADARHTLIMVDGQPVLGDVGKFNGTGDELMRLGAENIDRIEIVRGAATAKYGADAIGGVVNVITKAPKDKIGFQLNAETSYHTSWHDSSEASSALPSNWFMRADTGKIGKVKVAAWASKRDILPVYDSKYQWGPNVYPNGAEYANWYEKFKPTLRYYGDVKNTGVSGEYAFNDKQKISFTINREREDTERHSKAIWENDHDQSLDDPMQDYKRNIRRDTYRFSWNGAAGNTDWQLDINHGKMKEKDYAILHPLGQEVNKYNGTDTLYNVDWVEHEKTNVNLGLNTAINDQHLLSYGFGYTKEKAVGSRIKDAPKTHYQSINPWDYSQSLHVTSNSASSGDVPDSNVHDYKLKADGDNILVWDKEGEIYGGGKPGFTADDMKTQPGGAAGTQNNAALLSQYENMSSMAGMTGMTPEQFAETLGISKETLAKYNTLKETLTKQNPNYQSTAKDMMGQVWNDIVFQYYGYDDALNQTGSSFNPNGPGNQNIKYNGYSFYEDYEARKNRLSIGEAEVKRTYAYVQDAWQINDNTLLLPSLRIDHSDLFGSKVTGNMGMTHNLNGNAHRRLKVNFGTAYAEPGLGELYYNWEMFGGNPGVRGWYWKGNPNLKPEESFNMDISLEGENNKTYGRIGLFHNEIKNYMTTYFTGKYMILGGLGGFITDDNGNTEFVGGDRVYSFRNVGKAKITGLEAEVQQKFNDKWSAKLGYTWLHATQNSDDDMPERLLDRPQHKFDISLNYNDKNAGFRGALWGSYYMNMLDSNSISNEDTFIKDDAGNDVGRKAVQYKKKSFGIWNLLLEKDLDKDTTVYAGIDNLFNHRDDDRAYNDRVYRFGVNVKFDDLGKTFFGDSTPRFKKDGNGNLIITNKYGDDWFLKRTVDTTRKAGTVDIYGDYRVRSNMVAGDNNTTPMRETRTTQPTAAAVANASRKSNHGLEQRLRFGVDYQIADGLNLDVAGATSKRDTSYDVADKRGLHDPYLEKVELTKSTNKWDWTVGRIHEPMGVTGYWFGKEYDGARVMYTDKKTQVTVGYGDFSQTTGITNSAYNHNKRTTIFRAPTWSELLGNYGTSYYTPADSNSTIKGSDKYPMAFDPNAKANYLEKFNYANGLQHQDATGEWVKNDGVTDLQVAEAKLQVVKEFVGILKTLGTAAGTWDEYISGKKSNFSAASIFNTARTGNRRTANLKYLKADGTTVDLRKYDSKLSVGFDASTYYKQYGLEGGLQEKNIKSAMGEWYTNIEKTLGPGTFINADTDKAFASKEDVINSMFVSWVGGDSAYTVSNVGTAGGTEYHNNPGYSALNQIFQHVSNYGEKLNPMQGEGRDKSAPPIPLTGFGLDDAFILEGDLLVNDVIPAMDRAAFIKVRRQLSDNIGVEAWKLNSFGDTAHDDQGRELKIADVIGIGTKVRLGEKSMFSFDYGQNRSDMGKYFHGGIGTYGEYKGGSTPDFWVARLDYGIADTNAPGSWNAYVDYKAFDHGSFLGGTGADLPDRYLDGIRSFTAGFGYVPARNLLLEASYTFDAHSTQKRDTLYNPEDFSLGDYTRVSLTYKF